MYRYTQAEQDMIQQSHVTALAKTAAADAKATSESSFYNSSTSTSQAGRCTSCIQSSGDP